MAASVISSWFRCRLAPVDESSFTSTISEPLVHPSTLALITVVILRRLPALGGWPRIAGAYSSAGRSNFRWSWDFRICPSEQRPGPLRKLVEPLCRCALAVALDTEDVQVAPHLRRPTLHWGYVGITPRSDIIFSNISPFNH